MTKNIEYNLNIDDLINAHKCHALYINWSILIIIYGVCLLLGAIFTFTKQYFNFGFSIPTAIALFVIYPVLVFALYLFIVKFFTIPRTAKKGYSQMAELRGPIYYKWDENGFFSKTTAGEAFFEWNTFPKWNANDKTLLIYRSDHLFMPFPRNTPEQKEMVNEFIKYLTRANVPIRGHKQKK